MNESREPDTTKRTQQRLSHGQGEDIVVLEGGDPLQAAPAEPAEWDWDSDALAGEQHCSACGAWGPVFHREDGSRWCAACAHGESALR